MTIQTITILEAIAGEIEKAKQESARYPEGHAQHLYYKGLLDGLTTAWNKTYENSGGRNKEDISVEADRVRGFDKLNEDDAKIFSSFLKNFYDAWGLEAKETIVPIKVEAERDKSNGKYLRFEYRIYDRECWLHVKDDAIWY